MKVIAVEDDPEFREFLRVHFATKHPDIDLEVTDSGEQALAWCTEDRPDVVIVDSFMPGMGGQELYAKIKEHDPSIRVIAFSGSEREIGWADQAIPKGGRLNLAELIAVVREEGAKKGA